jgi:2-succinyl-5-enolpyruvyl-6-hydroxy-3-cyclohexene-1-carboxylate synthase
MSRSDPTASTTPIATSPVRGREFIRAMVAAGVQDFVLAPGSRSAPLALPLAAAERAGALRLHVRIDERSAGYTALGIAKASGRPVAVITTSGTAAVNLHPAIVEASYAGVPLIAVTADRPPALRGVGANQTIDQVGIFTAHVRWSGDLIAAGDDDAAAVQAALSAAMSIDHPGPVHVNIAFTEPLVDADEPRWREVPPGESMSHQRAGSSSANSSANMRRLPAHGLILVGDTGGFPQAAASPQVIEELAQRTGWPIIAEPSGNASMLTHSLHYGPVLLAKEEFLAAHVPDTVITIGRVGLHRSAARLLGRVARHLVIDPRPPGFISDPQRTAVEVLAEIPVAVECDVDPQWWTSWQDADRACGERLKELLAQAGAEFTGVQAAVEVVRSLAAGDLLVVGASWQVRHVSMFAGPIRARCISNRGTSGIDGVVSTAWGAASTHAGHTVALLGDLTALYDRNGLIAGAGEGQPALTYVVIDNDGGGIFSQLEQGAPAFQEDFERVFGTPHGMEMAKALQAPGVQVREVADLGTLRAALAQARSASAGVQVIVARCSSRAVEVAWVRRLAAG